MAALRLLDSLPSQPGCGINVWQACLSRIERIELSRRQYTRHPARTLDEIYCMAIMIRLPSVRRRSVVLLNLAVACSLAAVACGASQAATAAPTPTPITENFSGAIDKNGAVTFTFTVTAPGAITASITSLSPVVTLAVGMSIGTWDGTVCSASLSNDNARVSDQLTGNTSLTGSYCIRVYDVGNITATEQVAVTVTHS